MPESTELAPVDFRQRWPDHENDDVVLLDVRDLPELALAKVDGCVHIAMYEIPVRFNELKSDSPVVVMCHSGIRSKIVAQFLTANGFEQVFNLTGGIDAWSRELDSSVPRY